MMLQSGNNQSASIDSQLLRDWDTEHVWHPFTAMTAYKQELAPIIASGSGFHLTDTEGNTYLDGISSLWCNVHGHRVPEIDAAIREQLDQISHSTLLGMGSVPSIELARRIVEKSPPGLNHAFYSDSGSTAVEAALKIAFQFHRQREPAHHQRNLFCTISGAYHGDTVGAVSVGSIELFHRVYGALLFQSVSLPSPTTLHRPSGLTPQQYLDDCFEQAERTIALHADQLAAVIMEPLVQGAAGMLVHAPGYLKHIRELTTRYGIPLIVDEVAVGFGRTGTMFACEQEDVTPDLMILAKGLTGGYLPVSMTLATDEIYNGFLGDPSEGKTFFHGHTFTGNALGCAAGLASLELFEKNRVLENVQANEAIIRNTLKPLEQHPHVAEIRQKGIMVGIELVADRETLTAFPAERRTGHLITLAARKRGVILRPLGDVAVMMPAPAMPAHDVKHLCEVMMECIDEVTV